jgi:hypothetical protein
MTEVGSQFGKYVSTLLHHAVAEEGLEFIPGEDPILLETVDDSGVHVYLDFKSADGERRISAQD